MSEEKSVLVRNLTGHTVGWIDDNNGSQRRIILQGYEERTMPVDILHRLSFSYGGQYILRNSIHVDDEELAKEFGISEDVIKHEYQYTVEDVDKLLLEKDIDYLADALDFAPGGIKELIINRAVELQIDSEQKRALILRKTGHNVTQKIKNLKAVEAVQPKEDKAPSTRRVQEKEENSNSGRRVKDTSEEEVKTEEGTKTEE